MHAHTAAAWSLHVPWRRQTGHNGSLGSFPLITLLHFALPAPFTAARLDALPACSLNVDTAATVGDARIQRIIDALPQECEEAGRTCKK